ncbi:MAG: alkaline phosphatase, partial [Actinomycetota bacterium]|nr:alkaline phosphatase [Actinomycetota bacterium]
NYDPNGMVQWVVGTGGKSRGGLSGSRLPNSVTATASTFGVLELTLRSGSYDWRFIPEGSSSYQDSGTASCH